MYSFFNPSAFGLTFTRNSTSRTLHGPSLKRICFPGGAYPKTEVYFTRSRPSSKLVKMSLVEQLDNTIASNPRSRYSSLNPLRQETGGKPMLCRFWLAEARWSLAKYKTRAWEEEWLRTKDRHGWIFQLASTQKVAEALIFFWDSVAGKPFTFRVTMPEKFWGVSANSKHHYYLKISHTQITHAILPSSPTSKFKQALILQANPWK